MLKRIVGNYKWTPEQDDVLCDLYQNGVPVAEIAATINQQFGSSFTPGAVASRAAGPMGLVRETRGATVWTDEVNARLAAYIASGMSGRAAAAELGFTRSATLSQIHRLGLNEKATETANRDREMARAERERRVDGERYAKRMAKLLNWVPREYRQDSPLPPFVEVVDDPLNLSMAEVGRMQCRWITNDDLTEPTFCGHKTHRKSWCARHADVVLA